MSEKGVRRGSRERGMLSAAYPDGELALLLGAAQAHWTTCEELGERCLGGKWELFADGRTSVIEGWWRKQVDFLEESRAALVLDMENVETENVQLRERLTRLEGESQCFAQEAPVDSAATCVDRLGAVSEETKCASASQSVGVSSEAAVGSPSESTAVEKAVLALALDCEKARSVIGAHSCDPVSKGQEGGCLTGQSSERNAKTSMKVWPVTSSYRERPCMCLTCDAKGFLRESLELSFGVLGYTDKLIERASQNEACLCQMDLLCTQLEDLSAERGRVWCPGKQQNGTEGQEVRGSSV